MTSAWRAAVRIRSEIAARRLSRHRLYSTTTQANTLNRLENLFRALFGHLHKTHRGQYLNAPDDSAGNIRFVRDATNKIAGRDTRVVADVELNPNTRFVNPRGLIASRRFAWPGHWRWPLIVAAARRPILESAFARGSSLRSRVVFRDTFRSPQLFFRQQMHQGRNDFARSVPRFD